MDTKTTAVADAIADLLIDNPTFVDRIAARAKIEAAVPLPIDEDDWLTVNRAADYCKLSKSYLETLRTRGDGPAFSKLGRVVRYHKLALDTWLQSKSKKNTAGKS